MNPSPHSIKLLDEFLINQIKAGEIIERPANLIKEAIENSIDAQATKIEIHIVENGLEQITIRDNGQGIGFDDLPLAFCRHATSKIIKFQDLYNLGSFGFRGEALAAMAAIAQVTCVSRMAQQKGGRIVLEAGEVKEHIVQEGLAEGTLLSIKNLFFNTPARLKFIRSQRSEKNSLLRTLNAFFISNAQIEFHLRWDQKEKIIYRPEDSFGRFCRVLSGNRWKELDFGHFQKHWDGHYVSGFYGNMAKKSMQSKGQYLFINQRPIVDKTLHQILLSALEKLWPQGMSAPYLLSIDIPKNQLDVNVHPNKIMVKFARPEFVHSLVHSAIKESVARQDKDRPDFPGQRHGGSEGQPATNEERNLSHGAEGLKPLPFSLSHRHQIFCRTDGPALIIDNAALMAHHLDSLKESFAQDESTPLLVGIPFRKEEAIARIKQYPFWERDKFSFDFLESNLAICRSVPSKTAQLPHLAVVYHLLGLKGLFEEALESVGPLSSQATFNLIERYHLEELHKAKAVLILNQTYLSQLFLQ